MKKILVIFFTTLFLLSCSNANSVSYVSFVNEEENFVDRNTHNLSIFWKAKIVGRNNDIEEKLIDHIAFGIFEISEQSVIFTYSLENKSVDNIDFYSQEYHELSIDWSLFSLQLNGKLGIIIDFKKEKEIIDTNYYLGSYRTDHEFVELIKTNTNSSINESMREVLLNE